MGLKVNRIYLMDCRDGLDQMDPCSVDVVVTSPPYNIGKKYHQYDDNKPIGEYLDFLRTVVRKVRRVMKDDGSFFFNIGGKPSSPLIPMRVALQVFEKENFVLQNDIHWIKSIAIEKKDIGKNNPIRGDIVVGHYQPVNSPKYLNRCHEYIFHFTKRGDVKMDPLRIGVRYQDKTNIGRWNSPKDLRDRGNIWFIPYKTITYRKKQRPHPTPFPVELPEMCIKLCWVDEKPELVLDPFMGIGSTAVACKRLGIDWIGFEIDKDYVNFAEKRLLETLPGRRTKF